MTDAVRDATVRMDAMYARQRHIYDLTRKYYLFGRDRMLDRLAVPPGGTVLEIGCGTGRNLVTAARRYPDARLHGFDVSNAMLATACAAVARTTGAPVRLAHADATRFDPRATFGIERFDRAFCSYTLSMIPGWPEAVAAALDATAGSLHIVDFGQSEQLPRAFRRFLFGWLARFDVMPRAALVDVLEREGERRGFDLWFESVGRGYAWHVVLTRRSG